MIKKEFNQLRDKISRKNAKANCVIITQNYKNLYYRPQQSLIKSKNKQKLEGSIIVNDKYYSDYFYEPIYQEKINKVIKDEKFNDVFENNSFLIKLQGGGKNGQLEAFVSVLFKTIFKLGNENLNAIIKNRKLSKIDTRTVERKKIGKYKARKSYVYKRR